MISQLQAPYYVNATVNNLPLVVTSTNITGSQWRLVTNIFLPDRQSSALSTLKTFPNDSGSAVVDIARICNDYLEYDPSVFQLPFVTSGSGRTVGTFKIVMGEEYAASPSASVVAYNGIGGAGAPAFTCSFDSAGTAGVLLRSESVLNLYPAVNEYSNYSYNWPSSSWAADGAGIPGTGSRPFLTNDPGFSEGITNDTSTFKETEVKQMYDYDYGTVSIVNGYSDLCEIQDISIQIKNAAGTTVYSQGNYATISSSAALNSKLLYVGIGPANISASDPVAAGVIQAGNWDTINVDFEFVGGDNRNVKFKRQECSYYDRSTEQQFGARNTKIKGRTRFAFINKYGVWDYFNIPYPAQKQAKIKKSTYVKPQLNWQDISNTTASAAKPYRSDLFDVSSRGEDNYYTEYVDNYRITTDWLSISQSDWLTELFESPSVYIQNDLSAGKEGASEDWTVFYPGGFRPINIKNASFTWRSNRKAQKTFQYDIQFELSKVNIGRR